MKRALLTAALVIVVQLSNAQQWEFGVKGGINASKCTSIGNDFIFGVNAGAFGSARTGKIILQPEIFYSQQGSSTHVQFRDVNNIVIGSADLKIKINYLNVPFIVKFNPWKGLNIQGGPQVGFPVAAKSQNFFGNSATYVDVLRNTQPVFSAIAGFGYEFKNGLMLEARYDWGLTNMFKSDSFDRKNRVIQLSVGYKLIRKK